MTKIDIYNRTFNAVYTSTNKSLVINMQKIENSSNPEKEFCTLFIHEFNHCYRSKFLTNVLDDIKTYFKSNTTVNSEEGLNQLMVKNILQENFSNFYKNVSMFTYNDKADTGIFLDGTNNKGFIFASNDNKYIMLSNSMEFIEKCANDLNKNKFVDTFFEIKNTTLMNLKNNYDEKTFSAFKELFGFYSKICSNALDKDKFSKFKQLSINVAKSLDIEKKLDIETIYKNSNLYNIEKAIIEYDRNNEFNNFLKTMIDDCNNNSHYQKIDNEISNTKFNKIKNEKDKDNTIEF